MPSLRVADAQAPLSKLIDAASTTHERFEITRNGRRAAVLLAADDYDALREVLAVLSDGVLLAAHREGVAAIEAGDYVDADQLAHAMHEAGRLGQAPWVAAGRVSAASRSIDDDAPIDDGTPGALTAALLAMREGDER